MRDGEWERVEEECDVVRVLVCGRVESLVTSGSWLIGEREGEGGEADDR